jgi:co-chaperonin GroES (HSP10)
MSIQPWGRYIAVVDPPAEANDGTVGGVILPPGTGLDVLDKAVVIGVGPEVECPDGFEPGATVFYPHGAASEVGHDGIKFIGADQLIAWDAALGVG